MKNTSFTVFFNELCPYVVGLVIFVFYELGGGGVYLVGCGPKVSKGTFLHRGCGHRGCGYTVSHQIPPATHNILYLHVSMYPCRSAGHRGCTLLPLWYGVA